MKWSNLWRHYSSHVLAAVTVLGGIQASFPAVYAMIPPQVTVALGIAGLIVKVIPQPTKDEVPAEPGPEKVAD